MKKVKIMLVAALVVAAVGGALAFKAAKVNESFYCGDTPFSCPTLEDDLTVTTIDPIANKYCSTQITTDCSLRVKKNK